MMEPAIALAVAEAESNLPIARDADRRDAGAAGAARDCLEKAAAAQPRPAPDAVLESPRSRNGDPCACEAGSGSDAEGSSNCNRNPRRRASRVRFFHEVVVRLIPSGDDSDCGSGSGSDRAVAPESSSTSPGAPERRTRVELLDEMSAEHPRRRLLPRCESPPETALAFPASGRLLPSPLGFSPAARSRVSRWLRAAPGEEAPAPAAPPEDEDRRIDDFLGGFLGEAPASPPPRPAPASPHPGCLPRPSPAPRPSPPRPPSDRLRILLVVGLLLGVGQPAGLARLGSGAGGRLGGLGHRRAAGGRRQGGRLAGELPGGLPPAPPPRARPPRRAPRPRLRRPPRPATPPPGPAPPLAPSRRPFDRSASYMAVC
eukprot:tig00001416_g8959.t1